MEINHRSSINVNLKQCIPFNGYKDHDYMEVTVWTNGEGYDISTSEQTFSISEDELSLLNYLVASFKYKDI